MTREEKNYFYTLLMEEPDYEDEVACKEFDKKLKREWIEFQCAQYKLIGEMIRKIDEKFFKEDRNEKT